jgi:hypothetical protein
MNRRLIVLLTLCALGLGAAPPAVGPDELPTAWKLDEIKKAVLPSDPDCRAYVLAWKVVEDERPLRVESCLVLTVHPKDDGSAWWTLTHLYRHPLAPKPEWEQSMVHVFDECGGTWIIHRTTFDKQPTNKEIYGALGSDDVDWSFDRDKGWKRLGCRVCEKNWREAVGEKPTKFFHK